MKLEEAREVAVQLVRVMRPSCVRIEIAGSIRRGVSAVKDIEIVCIPSFVERPVPGSLLGETAPSNALWESLHDSSFVRWIKPGVPGIEDWPIKPGGRYWRGIIREGVCGAPSDIKLDVFIARPENWGVIFTIRTGSADFSRALVTYARDSTDYRVDGGQLVLAGGAVPCPDERVVFDALQLEWVEPSGRVGEQNVRPRR